MSSNDSMIYDVSIKTLDSYLLHEYISDQDTLKNTYNIAFGSATSIVLASKLFSNRKCILPSWFSAFKTNDIIDFEKKIILKIGSKISTMFSPSYFVSHLLRFIPFDLIISDQNVSVSGTPTSTANLFNAKKLRVLNINRLKLKIVELSNKFIFEFLTQLSSLLYAPSTIAITAIFITLNSISTNDYNYASIFMNKLPKFFNHQFTFDIPSSLKKQLIFSDVQFQNESCEDSIELHQDSRYYNFQMCLSQFASLNSVRAYMSPSPTSIAKH